MKEKKKVFRGYSDPQKANPLSMENVLGKKIKLKKKKVGVIVIKGSILENGFMSPLPEIIICLLFSFRLWKYSHLRLKSSSFNTISNYHDVLTAVYTSVAGEV